MEAICPPTEAATGAERDSDPPKLGQVRTEEGVYVESFLKVSLLLAKQNFIKVEHHGSKMLQHLHNYRSEKLSSADLLDLKLQMVKSHYDLVLENAEAISEETGNAEDGSSPEKSDGSTDSSSSLSDKRPQNSDWSATATGINETMSSHQGMDCLLLAEHNLLCEAFIITTTCLGIQQYMDMLPCLLNSLNRIWTQTEWNVKYVRTMSGLGYLFSDGQFLKMSYHVVKLYEEKLMTRIEEHHACDVFSMDRLDLTIPLFLRLLRCIHVLWTAEIGFDLLPEEVEKAKSLTCMELDHLLEISGGLYTIDSQESCHENKTRALLEGTRQRVYNFIGLCTTIKEAFPKLLESVSVGNALTEALECMELRHLGKLIHLVVIPVVKHCPRELLEEWTINFLEPILLQCAHRLHASWFYLLYNRQAHNLFNYGNLVGEDEEINKMGYKLLLEFTRKVSDLLETLAFMEETGVPLHEDVKPICNKDTVSSQDLNSMAPSSLCRFLLRHNFFEKLRMSLFGYFVDDEATIKALPFCHYLIQLAVSTNDVRLERLVVDDLLPCLIRRLDNELPCATQSQRLESGSDGSVDKKLHALCEDLYVSLVKDSDGEDKDNRCGENSYRSWLAKEMGNLQAKACSDAKELPEGSCWNWEFEDEFQRYLPAYMEMLKQVDSMDVNDERDYLKGEALLQKLRPEFRSKYGINSCEHPYMLTISSLRQQQFFSVDGLIYQRKRIKFISKLIKLKPYIKVSDRSSDIIRRLKKKSEIPSELPKCAVLPSVNLLHTILLLWEPVYHPLIRKSHMDTLLCIVDHFTKANDREYVQQVVPATSDFKLHLEPYAYAFFETKLKDNKYYWAIEQIRLHKELDIHLASGVLDDRMDEFISSKDDFLKSLLKDELAGAEFSDMKHDLIKLSLERRAEFVKIRRQIGTYSDCLRRLLENDLQKVHLEVLMNELEIGGFFDTDNDSINWEKESFSDLVNQFCGKVFAEHSLPKHFVIRGIMDYRSILSLEDRSQADAFRFVVGQACDRWIESCEKFWMESRYYEHSCYNIVRRPLEQVFGIGRESELLEDTVVV